MRDPIAPPVARRPAEAFELVCAAVTAGDLDAAMGLYEAVVTFAPCPGGVACGTGSLREVVAALLAIKLPLRGEVRAVLQADDIALVLGSWTVRGTGPEGNPVDLAGQSADVVRRQPDGSWRFVVTNPWAVGPGSDPLPAREEATPDDLLQNSLLHDLRREDR